MNPALSAAAQYPFRPTDGGRAGSRRRRQSNDCTVRAVAVAAGISYDAAYDILRSAGRVSGRRFQFEAWARDAAVNGFRFERRTFPAVKGQRRMNPVAFCAQHPTGRYIVKTAKHVFAVIDGVAHDERPQRDDRCVYACWLLSPTP